VPPDTSRPQHCQDEQPQCPGTCRQAGQPTQCVAASRCVCLQLGSTTAALQSSPGPNNPYCLSAPLGDHYAPTNSSQHADTGMLRPPYTWMRCPWRHEHCSPLQSLVICSNAPEAAGHHERPFDLLRLDGSSQLKVGKCTLVDLRMCMDRGQLGCWAELLQATANAGCIHVGVPSIAQPMLVLK